MLAAGVCVVVLSGCGGGASGPSKGSPGSTASPPPYMSTQFPPHANGAYVYDVNSADQAEPAGYWVDSLNCYNNGCSDITAAYPEDQIRMVYSYGGDLEISSSCTDGPECPTSDFRVDYTTTSASSGSQSTAAYAQGLTFSGSSSEKAIMAPVIDGSFNSPYLQQFTNLTPSQAKSFANKVASTVCADANVDGVEFDLEPFNISSKNAQYYFYMQVARDFAGGYNGDSNNDPLGCVDAAHPDGRFFAVFTSAGAANPSSPEAANLARILRTYGNGYAVAALYDLSSQPSGTLSTVGYYTNQAATQATDMEKWADQLGIDYAFAIPAGASGHEFTTLNGTAVGPPMLDYTTAAINAINASGARSDPLFIGSDVWFWGKLVHTGGDYMGPSSPTLAVLNYLAANL